MLKKQNKIYQNKVDVFALEMFALVLDYRLKKLPFFDRRFNYTNISITEENVVLFEIVLNKKKSLKYYFVFSELGIIPGKDWIITQGKSTMDFLVVLSRGISSYEKRLTEEILYRNVIQWLHGESTEKRVYLVIKDHVEKKYRGELFMKNMNKHKDMVLRYDIEVGISKLPVKVFDSTIKIDVKSSDFALKRMKENGKHKVNTKVHIMLVEQNHSDEEIISMFEKILKSHMKGHRVVA